MAIQNNVDRAREQAQEAQKKLIELKVRVAKAQAKAELANKRAKQLQQTLRDLRASKNKGGIIKSSLSATVASQIGTVRAAIIVQVQSRVADMLLKFSTGCPDDKDLQKIIQTRNSLLRQIASFRSRVQKLQAIAKSITATVRAIKLIIKIITSIPLPTAIIPPMTGGIGVPVSLLTKYSEKLIQLNKKLDKLADEAEAITSIISSIATPLEIVEAKLKSIDLSIQECGLAQSMLDNNTDNIAFTGPDTLPETSIGIEDRELDSVVDAFINDNIDKYIDIEGSAPIDQVIGDYITQAVDNLGQEGDLGGRFGQDGTDQQGGFGDQGNTGQQGGLIGQNSNNLQGNLSGTSQQNGGGNTGMDSVTGLERTSDGRYFYKGYELLIILDPTSPKIAPRRYAVAKDRTGVILLKGQPSFSSSTQILLDELKFRIDQLKTT